MRNALSGRDDVPPAVRAALLELQKSHGKLELEPVAGGDQRLVMTTKVEQVRKDCFIVSRPVARGVMHALGRYERYHMRFDTPEGRTKSRTQATSRVRIPSSGGTVLYGHKMLFPTSLQLEKPRRPVSALVGNDSVREAELLVLGRKGPILGLVQDLDANGARLHCRNAGRHLRPGQQGYLKLDLPDPVGGLEEPVKITGLEPSRRSGEVTVRVAFRDKNDRIHAALRAFHQQRQRRRAG